MRMSAIPPPPIASVVEEAYEVRRESKLALASLRAGLAARPASERRVSLLRSLAGLAALGAAGAAVGIVAWRGVRALRAR
jgi:hypothetical protein